MMLIISIGIGYLICFASAVISSIGIVTRQWNLFEGEMISVEYIRFIMTHALIIGFVFAPIAAMTNFINTRKHW